MIVSIHIPKTAGTSFKRMLMSSYGNKLLIVYRCGSCNRFVTGTDDASFAQNASSDCAMHLDNIGLKRLILRTNPSIVHGHIAYREVLQEMEAELPDIKYLFWLRDPIQRLLSHMEHSAREGFWNLNHGAVPFVDKAGNTIAQFVEGIPEDKLMFVGFQETFEQDIIRLAKLTGINAALVPSANVNPRTENRYSPSQEEALRLINLLAEDYKIYNHHQLEAGELIKEHIKQN